MMTEEKRINLDWVARGFTEKVIFDQKQKQENKKDPAVQFWGLRVSGRGFHKSKHYDSEVSLKCFRFWQKIGMDEMKRDRQ